MKFRMGDTDALQRFLHERIPLTRAMSLRVTGWSDRMLEIEAPLPENVNDKGTAFAGSVASLLALAGWAVVQALAEADGAEARVAVVSSRTEYVHPCASTLRARGHLPAAADSDAFRKDLSARGKARLEVTCSLHDGSRECARSQAVYVATRALVDGNQENP